MGIGSGVTDITGRMWVFRLNAYEALRLLEEHDIDIGDASMTDLMAEVYGSATQLARLVWAFIAGQADLAKISKMDALSAFEPEQMNSAREAIMEALVNFSQPESRGSISKAHRALAGSYGGIVEEAYQKAIDLWTKEDPKEDPSEDGSLENAMRSEGDSESIHGRFPIAN